MWLLREFFHELCRFLGTAHTHIRAAPKFVHAQNMEDVNFVNFGVLPFRGSSGMEGMCVCASLYGR